MTTEGFVYKYLPDFMKITILTLGTRGDVQSYAVLGQALKQRGHHVTLSTAKNFEQLVKSYGIDFVPVEADYQAILQSEEGKKIMKGNPFAISRNLDKWIYPLIRQSLTEFYHLAKDSDRVVYHVKTMADSFAELFPEKMIRAMVVPGVQPTRAFANPAFSGLSVPPLLHPLSYKLTNWGIKMLQKPIGAFRESVGLPRKYSIPETKFLYGISEHLLPKPADYPENAHFTGFWFGLADEDLPEALLEFIASGTPPLLLTFGSMPFQSKFDLQTAINTLTTQFDTRIIVVRGWGLDQTKRIESNPKVKVIAAAPYEKLFPLTKAVIHHGGIGTTAACLRAGKPCMICPILYPIGDQQFWGQQAYRKGFAPKPIPISKMTERLFLKSIETLLTNQLLYDNAQQLQKRINQENGVENAIAVIEKV